MSVKKYGAPGRSRTCDLQIRSLLLYPAELRAHNMAEKGGFEPPIQVSPYNHLAGDRLKPLGHFSV